ncbi:Calcium/calmodulin-dependent protein kinase [Bertholletia excelsa]
MKKLRPFKRSDLESFRSTSLKKEIPQPGKSPPFDDPATPEKQFPIRATEASPNYMKSTSSFEARKASSNKTQVSSSKRVRSLTQSPSFKPARAYSAKKCSPVALCEDLSNVQKATCSSTLKNSKFPSCLGLSPGATESEGSSAVKVCPYTFCSLNGHHHRAPLPPLKTFLTARRRMLKTQKSMKLKPKLQEMGLDGLERKSPVLENKMDFFIEIYANDAGGGGSRLNEDKQGRNKSVANDSIIDFETDPETSDMEWDDGNSDVSSSSYPILKIGHIVNRNFDEVTVGGGPEEISEQEGGTERYDSADPFQNSDSYISMENQEDNNKVSEAENKSPRMGDKRKSFSYKGEALVDGNDNEFVLDEFGEGQDEVYQSNVNGEEREDSKRDQRRQREEPVLPEITTILPNCISGMSEADHEIIKEENNELNQAFAIGDENQLEKTCHEAQISEVSDFMNSENQTNLVLNKVIVAGNSNEDENETEAEGSPIIDREEIFSPAKFAAREKANAALFRRRSYPIQPNLHNNIRIIKGKRPLEELGEITRKFNPKKPNFLLLEPDPESEKVDLRHQLMDERKNAEEWMIDYALQRVVTKLGPARKKKVALLVEAFEKVMPMPEHDKPLLRRASSGSFPHPRTIQTCI